MSWLDKPKHQDWMRHLIHDHGEEIMGAVERPWELHSRLYVSCTFPLSGWASVPHTEPKPADLKLWPYLVPGVLSVAGLFGWWLYAAAVGVHFPHDGDDNAGAFNMALFVSVVLINVGLWALWQHADEQHDSALTAWLAEHESDDT